MCRVGLLLLQLSLTSRVLFVSADLSDGPPQFHLGPPPKPSWIKYDLHCDEGQFLILRRDILKIILTPY